MSDNPADSLRRELVEAAREALEERRCICGRNHVNSDLVDAQHIVTAIWPLVEAARADERERLQQENQELRAALREIDELHIPYDCNNLRCSNTVGKGQHCYAGCETQFGPDKWPCDTRVIVDRLAVSDGN